MFKLIHLGDLHFGKKFHEEFLVENDQPLWIERFLEFMDVENPDAVVIAGDVYDQKDPTTDAIELFDSFITRLAERGKYVFIVPGNHDSNVRLSVGSEIFKDKKIFIAKNGEKKILKVRIEGNPSINFWLLPYVYRKVVASLLGRDDIETYDDALKALIEIQDINKDEINVLVAHQNVVATDKKPVPSGSESIIGGVGEVQADNFDAFDYVALGHIHGAQEISRKTIRYAGCPMFYDFSEEGRKKPVTIVTIDDDGKVDPDCSKEIFLPFYIKSLGGTFEELVDKASEYRKMLEDENRELKEKGVPYEKRYYLRMVVKGNIPSGGQDKLEKLYGQKIHKFDFKRAEEATNLNNWDRGGASQLGIKDQFEKLYNAMDKSGKKLDGIQKKILDELLDQQSRAEVYFDDKNKPKEEDNKLFLEEIINIIKNSEE